MKLWPFARTRPASERPEDIDADWLAAFERLHDERTGEWHLPPLLLGVDRFHPEKVEQWARLPAHCAPVERQVGDLFAALVAMERPRTVLETGTNMGYSAARIAAALARLPDPDGRRLYTIDVLDNHHLFRDMPCGRLVTFLHGRSDEVDVPDVSFDMLVLDSDHSYGTIAREIERFEPMLRPNGLILFHDSIFFDGVALAVGALAELDRFEVLTMSSPRDVPGQPRPPGVSIARKRRDAASEAERFRRDPALDGIEVDLDPSRRNDATWLADAADGRIPRSRKSGR